MNLSFYKYSSTNCLRYIHKQSNIHMVNDGLFLRMTFLINLLLSYDQLYYTHDTYGALHITKSEAAIFEV